jgi:hypothetical protein
MDFQFARYRGSATGQIKERQFVRNAPELHNGRYSMPLIIVANFRIATGKSREDGC